MNIAVIGTGYVGLVTGTCLAEAGHKVICVDIDEAKVERMRAGVVPIYEPGLETIFKAALKAGNLTITTSLSEAAAHAGVFFLALPTPPGADGSADLTAVLKVATDLGPMLNDYAVIIDKSTVPPGTAQKVASVLAEHMSDDMKTQFAVVSNPEFLREGFAVKDFTYPDRIVIGTDDQRARDILADVYRPFVTEQVQYIETDTESAEMGKYAANAFLAAKVTFANEIANVCELVGANYDDVKKIMGADPRIGARFLNAGIGYGGSCFPKDVEALQHISLQKGYSIKTLDSVVAVNEAQKLLLVQKLMKQFDGDVQGKQIALWGLAFKPDTDDIRKAPALEIIDSLLKAGARVVAFDPQAANNVRRSLGDHKGLSYAASPLKAATGADALMIATEWEIFSTVDLAELKSVMKQAYIFDGRNVLDPVKASEAGFTYESIGRPRQI